MSPAVSATVASSSSPVAFLAIDLGSSSGRVMLGLLWSADGIASPELIVSEAGRFANVPVQTPDGLGWDIRALWQGVLDGLCEGVARAREAGATIAGIGVDSWGVDYGRLTAAGQLRPYVRHHRDVDSAVAARAAAVRDLGADYAVTGVLDQAINTVHQLRQDAVRGIGATDDRILLIADLFVHLLSGVELSEASLASSTALLDRRTETWSTELAAGLPAVLPRIVPAGVRAGDTLPDVTSRIGADGPIPVWSVTAHDTAAAFSAVADAQTGRHTTVVSCGSWAVVGVALDRPLLTELARLRGFTQEVGAEGETLLVKNLSGMWLLQQAMREWASANGGVTPDLRDLIDDAEASAYTGTFDPADPALQAPGHLVERLERACTKSASQPPRTRGDLVRAILESLAIAYGLALGDIEELTGRAPGSVRLIGGGARNELLCELTARRTGLPVIAGPAEASVHGLLLQLVVASGQLPDLVAARAVTIDDGEPRPRRYDPDSAPPLSAPTGGRA